MAVRVIAFCFLLFLSLAAFADTLTGKVVKITDGDTLYGTDGLTAELITIDPATGAGTAIGPTGNAMQGLAFR